MAACQPVKVYAWYTNWTLDPSRDSLQATDSFHDKDEKCRFHGCVDPDR